MTYEILIPKRKLYKLACIPDAVLFVHQIEARSLGTLAANNKGLKRIFSWVFDKEPLAGRRNVQISLDALLWSPIRHVEFPVVDTAVNSLSWVQISWFCRLGSFPDHVLNSELLRCVSCISVLYRTLTICFGSCSAMERFVFRTLVMLQNPDANFWYNFAGGHFKPVSAECGNRLFMNPLL